ncbi:hypothetical protein AUC43_08635 [Hymenobacter sedentarius]|uniref:Outer membrane protein beta-barrel domain-containing protein n=1 Tax=Hymenobacter sedentarius TaxID=1411621 RepID=A0A0U4BY28_9BACT|nr:outer membrane beta-barrel protein [Hymenobacter sedentarius]ALW85153.1 hypothetical protein AUC43_08635 [Hymenobacter sedentarius]
MKTTLLLLLLAAGAAPAAHAQGGALSSKDYGDSGTGYASGNTGFGIKGGYNVSDLRGSGSGIFPNKNSLKAFNAGVYGQMGFSNFASLQVELLYIRKGFHTDQATVTTGGTTTTVGARDNRLDYLELPILFVGNVTETISFHVGPQVSLLTKVKSGDEDLSLKANGYNSVDYGAIGGVEARLGPARLGVRYDLGLGKIYKNGTVVKYNNTALFANGITDNNIHNQTFQVYLGIGVRR